MPVLARQLTGKVREYFLVFRWPFWCFFSPLWQSCFISIWRWFPTCIIFFFKIFYSLSEKINRSCRLICPALWSGRTRGRNTAVFLWESRVTHCVSKEVNGIQRPACLETRFLRRHGNEQLKLPLIPTWLTWVIASKNVRGTTALL